MKSVMHKGRDLCVQERWSDEGCFNHERENRMGGAEGRLGSRYRWEAEQGICPDGEDASFLHFGERER
jgi:hypothetical protein